MVLSTLCMYTLYCIFHSVSLNLGNLEGSQNEFSEVTLFLVHIVSLSLCPSMVICFDTSTNKINGPL